MSLQAFQQKIGVAADGKFGPATFRAGRDYLGITGEQAAHFFGQCAHESGGFKRFTENMNYTAQGLMRVWPSRFQSLSVAQYYAGDPEAIARRVYGGRMGNGPSNTPDGWLFRGRGAVQLTGRAMYQAFANAIGRPDVMTNPDIVAGELSFDSAAYFFKSAGIWSMAKTVDDASIERVTRKINGGTHGLGERAELTKKYFLWAQH